MLLALANDLYDVAKLRSSLRDVSRSVLRSSTIMLKFLFLIIAVARVFAYVNFGFYIFRYNELTLNDTHLVSWFFFREHT